MDCKRPINNAFSRQKWGTIAWHSMSNWDAMSIQMVWFASDARRANAAKLYSTFVGTDPDSFQSSKVPTPPIPNLSAASGNVGDRTYSVTVQPSRVDLVVQRANDVGSDLPDLLSNPDQIILELASKAALIGAELSSVSRLALVTTLYRPTDSHAAANEIVAGMVGLELPRSDVTDLAFQVNARVPLDSTSGVVVNRFLKFGVAAFHSVTFDFANQAIANRNVETFGANLVVDVNIVPHFQPLTPELQSQIWTKLADETAVVRSTGTLGSLWHA